MMYTAFCVQYEKKLAYIKKIADVNGWMELKAVFLILDEFIKFVQLLGFLNLIMLKSTIVQYHIFLLIMLKKKLGIKLSEVGYHHFMGTHNRVVKVDKDVYLEVIAIDPSSKSPNENRWFNLDNPILQNIPTCVCRTKMKYAILKDHKTLWPYYILIVGVNTEI